MKKIILTSIAVLLLANSVYSAQNYVFTPQSVQTITTNLSQLKNLPHGQYLRFYNIDTEQLNAEFINLSTQEEKNFLKTLSKEEKENYKYAKKIQKLIYKGNWNAVFNKYHNYYPAYLQYFSKCYTEGDFQQALQTLNNLKLMDRNSQIIPQNVMNFYYGTLYYNLGQYSTALNYFKLIENNDDDYIIASIANCYFALGNYSLTIDYCKKLKNIEYEDKELIFNAYMKLKNYPLANKYALELLNLNYCYENLMKVQISSQNDVAKLTYAYKARAAATSDNEILAANIKIADIEQKKLEKSVSKLTQFIKIPKWSDIKKQIPQNVTAAEITTKQDEFFKNANLYINRYSGQQLTNAFNSLNQDYINYIQTKQNQYYQEKQLEAQKALIQAQQHSNMLNQQLLIEQQERNYLERQHLYYMRRPRYYYW